MHQIYKKIKGNLIIYKKDLKEKGLYYSIIHRLYKIPFVEELLTPIVNFLKPDYILIDGMKLYIDKYDTTVSEKLVQTSVWEPFETKLFKTSIKPGHIVLDIGAHIGYYTLIASKKAGEKGKVFAFEPDPKNFNLLKKSIDKNGIKNVILVNKAVSGKSGKIRLYLNKENTGDHRIYDSKDKRENVLIDSTTLDDFFRKNDNVVNVIKMDIQGAELEAFKSGLKLIKSSPKLKIFTEFWPHGLGLNQGNGKDYLKLLVEYDFILSLIDEKKRKVIHMHSEGLSNFLASTNKDYVDLFCTK